jgi:hypothetical protein
VVVGIWTTRQRATYLIFLEKMKVCMIIRLKHIKENEG